MAKVCEICGKKPLAGHRISHSARKTHRKWLPNLQKARVLLGGRRKTLKVCTKCLKSGKLVRAI